jgi:hypothetical protein
MRVPLPLKAQFETEIENYRTAVLTGDKPVDRYSILKSLSEEILADPTITRNGKDRGACKRALDALLVRLVEI